ncbi:Peroxisomal membrane protein 11B [Halotydeus destructor]|nr:Peroxisomal membrane protein 11B [Halotydeus destructor]
MDALAHFNNQSNGREKLFRFIQYVSRFMWSLLKNMKHHKLTVERLKYLESEMSNARRVIRLGRFVEMMHSSTKSMNLNDPSLRITITMSRISTALFLFSDNLIWLNRLRLVNIDEVKWSKTANKLWLYSITMNLLRDLHELKRIMSNYGRHSTSPFISRRPSCHESGIFSPELEAIKRFVLTHKSLSVDLLKNVCDFFLPLSSLGHVNLSPTTVGLLGAVSSAAAMLQIIDSRSRLSPS